MLFRDGFLRYLTVVSTEMHAKEPRITDFRRRVYDATSRVPAGRVTTYKLLGTAIGCTCSRAIGQALKVNPFAPDVPCHRVVRSDLTLGGYSGHTQGPEWERKQKLLRDEGIRIDSDGRVDPEQLFGYED
jgi:methylated-DNA-[protein]-cysteine S-methyltransferase